MVRSKTDHRLTFTQNLVSGAVAGVTTRTLTAPLDVVKILAQVGTKDAQEGTWKTFSNVYRKEGVRSLWKGNLIGCFRLFPHSAIQFATFKKIRLVLANEQGRLSVFSAMVAGAGGGLVATIAIYPTDTLKTRMTVQANREHYTGIANAVKTILRREGFFAFYKGLSTSIIGVVPFAGAMFCAYELIERAWRKPKSSMTPAENFMNGCIAAAIAQTASHPFDTIRKKLQAHSLKLPNCGGVDVCFTGMRDSFKQTVKANGIEGLWRGLIPTLLKVVPYNGLMFVMFEASKRVFLYNNGYTTSPLKDEPLVELDQSLKPHEVRDRLKVR